VKRIYLHWVGSPENESVGSDGHEECAELGALGRSVCTSVQGKVPDDEDVGNAGNGVPAPLLGGTFLAKSSEQTCQDHDEIGDNGHDDVSTRHASQKTEVEDQERSSQAPVDIAGPEDLAVHLSEGVGYMIVLLADNDLLDGDTVSGSHGKVRQCSEKGDYSGDGVVEALRLSRLLACIE
jgi:hypothetical protein